MKSQTTNAQRIEQSLIDNKELAKAFILDNLQEYKANKGFYPTCNELHWFIFEEKGIRIDKETINDCYIF